jgi:hypothetical protein
MWMREVGLAGVRQPAGADTAWNDLPGELRIEIRTGRWDNEAWVRSCANTRASMR